MNANSSGRANAELQLFRCDSRRDSSTSSEKNEFDKEIGLVNQKSIQTLSIQSIESEWHLKQFPEKIAGIIETRAKEPSGARVRRRQTGKHELVVAQREN